MLIRALLIVACVFLALTAVRKLREAGSRRRAQRAISDKTVQCAYCAVYLPRTEAVMRGERSYCSAEHAREAGE